MRLWTSDGEYNREIFNTKFKKFRGKKCILYIASYGLYEGNNLLMPYRFYNQNNNRMGKEMNCRDIFERGFSNPGCSGKSPDHTKKYYYAFSSVSERGKYC
jgi:hypothetical protein